MESLVIVFVVILSIIALCLLLKVNTKSLASDEGVKELVDTQTNKLNAYIGGVISKEIVKIVKDRL